MKSLPSRAAWAIAFLAIVLAVALGAVVTVAGAGFPSAGAESAPPSLTRDSTELAVLTYNVKSLPFPAGGWNKDARMQAIRSQAHRYDVVLLQEAFTSLPSLLNGLDSSGAVVSERFGPATRPVGLFGSTGLAMAILRPLAAIGAADVEHYSTCSGTFTRALDCLAAKGFIMQRVRVGGAEIDVYATHLDADPRDAPTRERQLQELGAAMQRMSAGRAVILGGDFNIDRSDTTEFRTLQRFASSASLTDAAAMQSAAWPEHLDFIFYRGSAEVDITLRESGEDPSFRTATTQLSDHPAMYAILRVTSRGGTLRGVGR